MSLPYTAGSLYSTVDDLYLWDQALYTDKVLPAALKERMFTPKLSNYGYGWAIRKRPVGAGKAERTVIGHGGGINGFSTLITRVPEDRHLIVMLSNSINSATSLGAMTEGALDILYGRTPVPARKSIATVLYKTVVDSGVTAAIAQYRDIKQTRASEFNMAEDQLIRLGNELTEEKRSSDAARILELNVEVFPLSAAAHFALAEAYRQTNETALAIRELTRTLELDPKNKNAAARLQELNKR